MALLNVDKLSVHFGDESAPFRRRPHQLKRKTGEVVGIVEMSPALVNRSVRWQLWGLIDYPGRA